MISRSSSTPINASLLSSPLGNKSSKASRGTFSHAPSPINSTKKLTSKKATSSPVSESKGSKKGSIRRVQSTGNLDVYDDTSSQSSYESSSVKQCNNKFKRKNRICTLEPIPSFSMRNHEDDSDDKNVEIRDEETDYTFRPQDYVIQVNGYDIMQCEENGKTYLTIGTLGVSGRHQPVDFSAKTSFSVESVQQHYKKSLQADPGNPLYLRNYAQFLYQRKGDLYGAEEYFSRAILADPGDAESLSQYGNLIWELYGDKERAADYFKRALQAATEESHISAAYANFLWSAEEDENEVEQKPHFKLPAFCRRVMATASALK